MESLANSLSSSARRHFVFSACAAMAFGGMANSNLRGQTESLVGEPIRVPLTVGTFDERTPNDYLKNGTSRVVNALQEKPASQIKREPKLMGPTYYRIPLGGREVLAILDVGQDADRAVIYFDFDGLGVFEATQGIEAVDLFKSLTPPSPWAVFKFGPITLPKTDEAVAGPVEIMISCRLFKDVPSAPRDLLVSPQKVVRGKLCLGSDEYAVAVVDGAFKGRFEPIKPELTGDQPGMGERHLWGQTTMAIDLNKNGLFDWSGEISGLVSLVRINGKYFHVSVALDGSEAIFQEAKPELGIFDTKCASLEMFVVSDKCAALLTPNAAGKWELPSGKYREQGYRLRRTDADANWVLTGAQPSPAMRAFEISPGTTTLIDLGPPLVLKYSVEKIPGSAPGAFTIALNVIGKSGETYFSGAVKDHHKEPKASFIIQSEAGALLADGTFEYGRGGTSRYSWRVPPHFKGGFRILTNASLGPFEYKQSDEILNLK